ncbi:helix-turn-helix domain-containing protein [Kordiimonas gwangyangensis]|uniref:helix-turn-helix domain-containing protein n=1 Tax=Kordiimonas gwangyangensis TaxID=288022 RepID=UPI0004708352|nr:helix-turn-helix transcriptional regulator [Kordiimonas gwangyangensis]
MKFGDYLREKREKHGWTQPEAAARAQIEQSYLSKLETGKSYPSEDIFSRLVKTYDIDFEDMSRTVFAAELDKLREISAVRAMVLKRGQSEARFMRAWLVAGLVMIMLGGGMFGLAPPSRRRGISIISTARKG